MRQFNIPASGLRFTHYLLLFLCFSYNALAIVETSDTATLQVNFNGLSSVHTNIRISDGIGNSATGASIKKSNRKNDSTTVTIPQGIYDLVIQKGSGVLIIDNVDCNSASCTVNDIVATLTINFPGLSSVHSSVHIPDGTDGQASGEQITKKNRQTDQAVIPLLRQIVDVNIRKNAGNIVVDNVDCRSGDCEINELTANLTVNFPNMKSVHTAVRLPDNTAGQANGEEVTHKNWQNEQAQITVFRSNYDLYLRNGSGFLVVDNIDCSTGECLADNLTSTLTVEFPGLNNVNTAAYNPDQLANNVSGDQVTKKNRQNEQAIITFFPGVYDIKIHKGDDSYIVDDVDCSTSTCSVKDITALMTVKFPGLNSMHTSVYIPDNQNGKITGSKISKKNRQTDQAEITVFKNKYDVSITRKKSSPIIKDNIDCSSGTCVIDDLVATMTVNFEGMSGVHTAVYTPDDAEGTAAGEKFSNKNSQADQAIISVLKQSYDIQVKKGPVTKVIDNINCTSGTCSVNELTAKLDISFPGLRSVHSSTHIPDSVDNVANGERVAKSNWKTHQTSITMLRGTYDVKVAHAVESVFDNVDCNAESCQLTVTGNVQALLINGDLNQPLADQYLTAYEKLADGTLTKVIKGKTTAQGQVNFTLVGIESDKVYVLKTYNPLGNRKTYYSSFISTVGEYKFIVTEDGENTLDLTPPNISFSSPQNAGSVQDTGFLVTGVADDNREIDKVEFSVNDPLKGAQSVATVYDAASKTWSADVPAAMISLDNDIVLTAIAFDLAQNQSTASISVSVTQDNQGPEINITSHTENAQVPVTGFLLSGNVNDLTGIATLQANLVDTVLGQTISNQNVDFSINNGTWTLVIDNGLMSEGGTVDITLNATDTAGNPSVKSIHLLVVAVDYSNAHMINRITFGSSPELLLEVDTLGASTYLEQQLNPDSIDDSDFESMLGSDPQTKEELQSWTLMHMLHSKRQLLEVMTWFWDNHFNTDINTKRNNAQGMELSITTQYELDENKAFRANALGKFSDLLAISAKSPAMLIYLDSISNVVDDSNENYAREVDELHTLGVGGGYTAQDVENGAEIFTGWHVLNGAFFFDESLHNAVDSHTMFAETPEEFTIDAGGVEQGEQLLKALASHPSTASFICGKLVTVFVNDVAPELLVERCAEKFQTLSESDADNQVEQVLRLIMQSAEFNNTANYRSKIKTPVEFVIGALRNLEAASDASDLAAPIRSMGIRLYENPVPTGWSEIGADWINASLLIERIKWVNKFSRKQLGSAGSINDPLQFYPGNGFETADGIVGYLLQLTVGDDFTELGRNNALNILGTEFDLSNPDSDELLRQLNGNVMSYPQYQFQ